MKHRRQNTPSTFRHHSFMLRWPKRLTNCIAWVVLISFVTSVINPTIAVARETWKQQKLSTAATRTEFEQFSDHLVALEDLLDRVDRRLAGRHEFAWQENLERSGGGTPPPIAASRARLSDLDSKIQQLMPQLDALQVAIKTEFAEIENHLLDKNIPEQIRLRHTDYVTRYEARYAELKGLMNAVRSAKDDNEYKAAIASARDFLAKNSSKQRLRTNDPKHLAFGPPSTRARAPDIESKALAVRLGLTATTSSRSPKSDPTSDDLAETEDVQFTAAIRAKAEALGKNPLAIYNFVHANVAFEPTYGSIQGADHTLQTLRGNAFDTASLLIALLRASDIPARYVYGTIEVPVEQAKNWLGGVSDPASALQLLGQGGIPSEGRALGGTIRAIRLEHVWVDAFVDFAPSRGARVSSSATWVRVDASYKQYDLGYGYDVPDSVPFDANAFSALLEQSTTVDPSGNWLQGTDTQGLQAQVDSYAAAKDAFVASRNPAATVRDVIGNAQIRQHVLPLLPGQLPYKLISQLSSFASLPESLRWRFKHELEGAPTFEASLPALSGKSISLSFRPATAADEAVINSYVPGNDTLPSGVPAYLVSYVSERTVDSVVTSVGPSQTLGEELTATSSLYQPGVGWTSTENIVEVGNYYALGVDGAGFGKAELQQQKARLEATRDAITSGQTSFTSHETVGAVLHQVLSSFFVETGATTQIVAQATKISSYRLPSYGTVSTQASVQYWFGLPRVFSPKGVLVDIDRVAQIAASRTSDQTEVLAFNRTIGALLSTHEHLVLQQAFGESNGLEAISATKAISKAWEGGQRIYNINAANVASVMPSLALPTELMAEIVDAAVGGRTVIVHSEQLSYANETTVGYIVLDPETGAGAYKIFGGANGGLFKLVAFLAGAFLLFMAFAPAAITAGIATIFVIIATMINLVFALVELMDSLDCGGLGPGVVLTMVIGTLLSKVFRVEAVRRFVETVVPWMSSDTYAPLVNAVCRKYS